MAVLLVGVGLVLIAVGVVLIWQGSVAGGALPLILGALVLLAGSRLSRVKSAGFSPTRGFTIDFYRITRDIKRLWGR